MPSAEYSDDSDTPQRLERSQRGRNDIEPLDIGASPRESGVMHLYINASANLVSIFCKPKQIIVLMRLLKASTFCVLALNICAEFMFLFFVALNDVGVHTDGAGTFRDTIIRIFGVLLSLIAIAVELDMDLISRKLFAGFRPYISRSLLLFFIATISQAHFSHNDNSANIDDNIDDDYVMDIDDAIDTKDIPGSAVVFDVVTSTLLFLCSIGYFLLGALCCDRYTSKALAASAATDPRTTEIPSQIMIGEPVTPYRGHDEV